MSLHSMDINILLDFLRPSEEGSALDCNIPAQLASLESLSSMCSNSDKINYLREVEGINLIWNLCCSTESLEITHSCLFALSCIAQNNVYAQQDLCLEHVFVSLNCLLESPEISMKTKILSTYLLLSLVSKNKQGQTLVVSSGCLSSLMTLFSECSQDKFNSFANFNTDEFEFFKVVIKTLTYATNVPLNVENQNKLSDLLPWIINGVHCSQNNSEITLLCCELLTVVVEDNKKCQEKALQCRAVEALILQINGLLPTRNEKCLGSAVVALNHVLADEDTKHWKKFLSFGGSKLLIKLLTKGPSNTWTVYHINQTLMLLSKYIVNCGKECFDNEYRWKASQLIIKLMKVITDDDYFQKMAVHILAFALEPQPNVMCLSNAELSLSYDEPISSTPLSSFMDVERSAKLRTSGTILDAADNTQALAHTSTQYATKLNRPAYTTIMVKKNRNGHAEIMLDISKSSKEALKSSSGIYASPTENVFRFPPFINKRNKNINGVDTSEPRFRKPASPLLKHRSTKPVAKLPFHKLYHQRMYRKLNNSRCGSVIRYSTPKAKKFHHKEVLFGKIVKKQRHSPDTSDVISLCGDLIEKEALNSVKKQRAILERFGSSGSLIRKNPKASSVFHGLL